jgi:hypothetical protein
VRRRFAKSNQARRSVSPELNKSTGSSHGRVEPIQERPSRGRQYISLLEEERLQRRAGRISGQAIYSIEPANQIVEVDAPSWGKVISPEPMAALSQ